MVKETTREELFMELASDTRLGILQKLYESDLKLSKIASELDLTIQETHRNMSRLSRLGLVEKSTDNSFTISSFGKLMFNQLAPFDFLLGNENYFKKHTTGDLPQKFVERLGELRTSTLICGVGPVFEHWKRLAKEAQSYIHFITNQYPFDIATTITSRVKDGIKISNIFSKNIEVPKERDAMLKKSNWTKMISDGIVKRRMLETVKVCTTITDKEACIFFPDLTGQTDLISSFFSKDEQFLEWCNDYFQYQWERADSFDEKKLLKS
ncbi:MAG TPA: transcriptional regulator [Nitrosopumilaceae archaeon]|nr:transcriptional regulator [Nitrosopumilaceae archaeon]